MQKAQREMLLYPWLAATDISLPGPPPWGQLEKSLLSCPNDLCSGLKQLCRGFTFPSVRIEDDTDALQ